jgi:hypothetical protein
MESFFPVRKSKHKNLLSTQNEKEVIFSFQWDANPIPQEVLFVQMTTPRSSST